MKEYDLNIPHKVLVEKIKKDFPGVELSIDTRLKLYADYLVLLKTGKKSTTIRFRRNKIRCPINNVLPLVETKPDDANYENGVGSVLLEKIVIKTFGELNDDDVAKDGFSKKEELVDTLQKIYGHISNDELVTIYYIKSIQLNKGA